MAPNKLEREAAILRTVYSVSDYDSLEHQDRPDFVIRLSPADPKFGVEITELYRTNSDARATHHPEYISRLLAGGRYMHKEDEEGLPLATVAISDSKGNLKYQSVPAIIRPEPSHTEHYQALARTIEKKTRKLSEYQSDLDHTNLVVLDRFPFQDMANHEYSIKELFTPELRAQLQNTQYREIFLVSQDHKGQQYYRPLQLLLLMEAFYSFIGAVNTFEPAQSMELSDVIPTFTRTSYAKSMGIYEAMINGDLYATYRGAAIRHSGDQVQVFDMHGHRAPVRTDLDEPRFAALEQVNEFYTEFMNNNEFIASISLPVVETIVL